jgi:NAD(P)-dependent dehydrogenase (short-subunit alcohol dehydrogenase family)
MPRNPLGIVGTGLDIASMVLFLCSDAARFVSGQVIAVDGGGSTDLLKLDLAALDSVES